MTSSRSSSAACIFLVVAATLAFPAAEGKSTPGPAADCMSLVMQMADCLSFVTNATVAKPEGDCCAGLKTVLKSNPECLCEVFKSSAEFGITVNVTKAVSLPSACHVRTPSIAKCGISPSPNGAPAGSPTSTPIANPPSGMSAPPAPAPTSSSSTTRISIGLVLVLMTAAIFF